MAGAFLKSKTGRRKEMSLRCALNFFRVIPFDPMFTAQMQAEDFEP